MCVACSREHAAARKQANPEHFKARPGYRSARAIESSRAWKRNNRERSIALCRRWYAGNVEYARAQSRQWHRDHPEQSRQNAAAWRRSNPDKVARNHDKRRARKMSSGVGDGVALEAFNAFVRTAPSVRCYWCGTRTKPRGRHKDHIIPLSRGGAHSVGNLCVSCTSCNRSKHAKMPEAFRGQSELPLG